MKSAIFKKNLEAYPRNTKLYSDEHGVCCAAILCFLYIDQINDDCDNAGFNLHFNLGLWSDGHSHQLPGVCVLVQEKLFRRGLEIDSCGCIEQGVDTIYETLENDPSALELRQLREAIIQRHAVQIVSICARGDLSHSAIYQDSLASLCEERPDLGSDLLKGLIEELGRTPSKVVAAIIQELVFGTQRQAVAIVSGCMKTDEGLPKSETDSLATLCEQWPNLGTDLLTGVDGGDGPTSI